MSHCLRSHGSTLVLTGDAVNHMCIVTVAKQAPGVSELGSLPDCFLATFRLQCLAKLK